MTVTVAGSGVPQTDQGRSRRDMVEELVSYIGGTNIDATKHRAGKSLDTAVRRYNDTLWKFNVVEQDVTLSASTDEYDLAIPFRAPMRAYLLDASSNRRGAVPYVDYTEWAFIAASDGSGTGTTPKHYTIRNSHREAKVIYTPLGATLKYPTVHHIYYTNVRLGPGQGDRLNVPDDVEESLFRWALYDLVLKERGPGEAGLYAQEATALRARCERAWRAWPEIPAVGVEGHN